MEKARILIVEDDAITAMDIENQLKNLGYGVTAKVAYGEDVIKEVKENTPDLVLMDIVLKGEMDGIEAADEIRSQFDIPVVFLTSYADRKRLERAKLTTPFGYIIKPFQDKDFSVSIEMALYVAKIDAERKRKEVELKEKGETLSKYKTYIDVMGDALIVLNMERKVIKLNKTAIQLLRYTEEDIPNLCFETIFPEKEHGQHYAEMELALDTGTVRPFETLVLTKNGEEIPVLFSGTALKDDRNEPIGFVGVCRDITEFKRLEEVSSKVTALEAVNVVLENFVSDALGNLLNPIYAKRGLTTISYKKHSIN